ncbi:WD40 repeat-like protein [Gonapodya prolifera JEL478]|uniref:WD40 repeat-like protein n=1 Tax=Gonapodya prolifera (strain JEL478) TaxID=1344416 RepID=A0A139AY93_GONPJ|nr:WD40 repeat-like protein [Gonapodya prolifera JEL478]|eukprot:KXS21543.1 WD40 repeat-like protein [Gonapodya prolifera JEL478]
MPSLSGDRKIAAIIHRHVFGLNFNVLSPKIHLIEDFLSGTSLLYPVGSNLVLNHITAKKQSFLPLSLAFSSQGAPASPPRKEDATSNESREAEGNQDSTSGSAGEARESMTKQSSALRETTDAPERMGDHAKTPDAQKAAATAAAAARSNMSEALMDGITATFVSSNNRYVAIATRTRLRSSGNPLPPSILIFDLQTMRHRRTIQPLEGMIVGREFISVCMSADNKVVVAATGTPDWRVCAWSVDSGKLLAVATAEDISLTDWDHVVANSSLEGPPSADQQLSNPSKDVTSTSKDGPSGNKRGGGLGPGSSAATHDVVGPSVTKVSMNPLDVSMLAVTGPNIFRILKLEAQGGFKVIRIEGIEQSGTAFLSHSWHPSRRALLVTTSKCQLYIISLPHPSSPVPHPTIVKVIELTQPVHTTTGHPTGFATGSATGVITLWDWNLKPQTPVLIHVAPFAPGEIIPDQVVGAELISASAPKAPVETGDLLDFSSVHPTRTWSVHEEGSLPSPVTDICITKDGLQVVCCLADNNVKGFEVLPVTRREVQHSRSGTAAEEEDTLLFEAGRMRSAGLASTPKPSFHLPNHGQAINSFSISLRKPLVATSSGDRTIRVWNYVEPYAPVITRKFADEALCVALHPSGMYMAVAFMDRVRVLAVTVDDLRQVHEIAVRSCRECVFSPGGQFLAIAYGTSPSTVQVHDAWSWARLSSFRGHSGKVKSIAFAADDRFLITAGTDGVIYGWEWKSARRIGELIIKGAQWINVVVAPPSVAPPKIRPQSPAAAELNTLAAKAALSDDPHNDSSNDQDRAAGPPRWAHVFGVATDRMIREIADMQIVREIVGDIPPSQLVISQSGTSMIVGTNAGTIRSYRFPFEDEVFEDSKDDSGSVTIPRRTGEFVEHQVHSGPVSRLKMSWDDRYLFSVGDDGCLFIFNVVDGRSKYSLKEKEWTYGDEALLSRAELDDRIGVLADTKLRLEELKLDRDYQLRVREVEFNQKVKEITDAYLEQITSLKGEVELLGSTCVEEKVGADMELDREVERHKSKVTEIEHDGSSVFYTEVGNTERAEQVLRETKITQDNALLEQNKRFDKEVETMTTIWEQRLQGKGEEVEKIRDDLAISLQEQREELLQDSRDNESELKAMRLKFDRDIAAEKDMAIRLRSETGIFRKKMLALQDEITSLLSDKTKALEEKRRAEDQLRKVRERLAEANRELQLRDQQIDEIERRIYELKKKNAELEKWKFVLDFKIKEIKGNIEPRAVETEAAANQINEVGVDLSRTDDALQMGQASKVKLSQQLNDAIEKKKHEKRRKLSWECKQTRFKEEAISLLDAAVRSDIKRTRKIADRMYKTWCLVAPGGVTEVSKPSSEPLMEQCAREEVDRQLAVKPLREELSSIRPLESSAERALENARERARRILFRTSYRVNGLSTDAEVMKSVDKVAPGTRVDGSPNLSCHRRSASRSTPELGAAINRSKMPKHERKLVPGKISPPACRSQSQLGGRAVAGRNFPKNSRDIRPRRSSLGDVNVRWQKSLQDMDGSPSLSKPAHANRRVSFSEFVLTSHIGSSVECDPLQNQGENGEVVDCDENENEVEPMKIMRKVGTVLDRVARHQRRNSSDSDDDVIVDGSALRICAGTRRRGRMAWSVDGHSSTHPPETLQPCGTRKDLPSPRSASLCASQSDSEWDFDDEAGKCPGMVTMLTTTSNRRSPPKPITQFSSSVTLSAQSEDALSTATRTADSSDRSKGDDSGSHLKPEEKHRGAQELVDRGSSTTLDEDRVRPPPLRMKVGLLRRGPSLVAGVKGLLLGRD